jgi:hypothetical protein
LHDRPASDAADQRAWDEERSMVGKNENAKGHREDVEIMQLFNKLYSDVSEEEAFYTKQPLLAHYTSIEVLEKILGSNEVWFSNPLFMNDVEEVRFGLFQGVPLATTNSEIDAAWKTKNRVDIFKHAFNHYFQEFANQHVMDTYVFCLSEHAQVAYYRCGGVTAQTETVQPLYSIPPK